MRPLAAVLIFLSLVGPRLVLASAPECGLSDQPIAQFQAGSGPDAVGLTILRQETRPWGEPDCIDVGPLVLIALSGQDGVESHSLAGDRFYGYQLWRGNERSLLLLKLGAGAHTTNIEVFGFTEATPRHLEYLGGTGSTGDYLVVSPEGPERLRIITRDWSSTPSGCWRITEAAYELVEGTVAHMAESDRVVQSCDGS
jgi:hypothetical protein